MLCYVVFIMFVCLTHASSIKRVLVVGGSGRVGGSTTRSLADSLASQYENFEIVVAGRDKENWLRYKERLGRDLPGVSPINGFINLDIGDSNDVDRVMKDFDLIIHTAGPFQGLRDPTVLRSALFHGKSYLDVCDDIPLSRICRGDEFQNLARKTGGNAVISAGIWPGCSSLLAQDMIEEAKHGSNSGLISSSASDQGIVQHETITSVEFSFFTAGSGNAGPTILTATFLLLGEDVTYYLNGKEIKTSAASDPVKIHFGDAIGEREIVRLNLIEAESCQASNNNCVPTVSTRFGTAPPIWNKLFILMAKVIPQ